MFFLELDICRRHDWWFGEQRILKKIRGSVRNYIVCELRFREGTVSDIKKVAPSGNPRVALSHDLNFEVNISMSYDNHFNVTLQRGYCCRDRV